ncbi:MAG: DUF1552 domain-containing protein [Deltaproteobacteria bacterium]|nr:DUF1552 domain-containing protein [Deltaproteobacteria bacterium]
MAIKLTRRSLLRGAGGAALALPALEIMGGHASAAPGDAPPARYMFGYCGMSTGAGSLPDQPLVPSTEGAGYALPEALLPLEEHGVVDAVTVVSGLSIPYAEVGGEPPPGGRIREFHGTTLVPQISGMRATSRNRVPSGPSSDQIVADAIAGDTLHHSLSYRVQAAQYAGDNSQGGSSGRLSYAANGDSIDAIDPISSPRVAHESLFSNFVPPDPAEAAAAQFLLERRRSVVDRVREHAQRLSSKLGVADQQRLERHLDEIRALEERLDAPPPDLVGDCALLPHPGEDPPIGGAHPVEGGNVQYDQAAGWSDEQLRAEILTDLAHMAFACDLSRVVAMRYSYSQAFLNAHPFSGHNSDVHGLGHSNNVQGVSDAAAWHIGHFARLVAKLQASPEVDGSTLLDHTALVLCFEGGHGFDPETGSSVSPHSTDDMVMLIAGRAGGLSPGRHIVAPGRHPANVIVSAMNAVGVDGGLGEIGEGMPELFE